MAACPSNVDYIDLVLIGKTGYGKSSVGNTILNYPAFETSNDADTLTNISCCRWGYSPDLNKEIKIVDTPGTSNTTAKSNETMEKYLKEFPLVMGQCPKGFHAVILVLKYGVRFTDEDQDAIKTLKKMFGNDFVKEHCIIVMTHGDAFALEYEEEEDPSFESWCKKQQGPFKDLLQECDHRIILFYNKMEEFEKQRRAAVVQLIRSAVKLSEKGRYTNKEFEKCYSERERLLLKYQLPKLSLNIQRSCSLLMALVILASEDEDLDEKRLNKIQKLVQNLENEVQKMDNDTGGLLKKELETVRDIKQRVDKIDVKKSVKEQFQPTLRMINFIMKVPSEDEEKTKAIVASVLTLETRPGQFVELGMSFGEIEIGAKK